mgnify:CR=1 FL=1
MIDHRIIALSAAGLLLVGCATAPQNVPELDSARAEVARVAGNPMAEQAAGVRLRQAREALANAERARESRKPLETITHQAYRANALAQIAAAQIRTAQSRQEIKSAEATRNQVLLEARDREAQQAQARSEGLRQETDTLRSQLEELRAKQTDRGMVLTLGDVLFDTAKATLKPGAALTIDRLADFMRRNQNTKIIVEGHTDSRGSDAYNLRLSEERAAAVADALRFQGIASARVQKRGMGKGYPVASNDTAAGRQRNRRVEIIFSDAQGQFQSSAAQSRPNS